MKRRALFSAVVGTLVFPWGLRAQVPGEPRRIGFLNLRAKPNEFDEAFRDALRNLGYVEGRSIQIEYRWAAGSEKRAQELATELVAGKVEVIVTATTAGIRSAMHATRTIPIVMAASADPLGAGLVGNLARPGGNVTGLSMISTDTAAKRLQLLRDVIPSAKRVAALIFGGVPAPGEKGNPNAPLIEQLQAAARHLGLSLNVTGFASAADLSGAFASLERERAQALIVQANAITNDNRQHVAELAARHRLPAMYEDLGYVEAGGLLSYGPSIADMYRRAAGYVDRILKGAKPAEMPVELPVKYDLAVSLKTARALGLTIPQSVLVRADRVIE